MTKDRSIENMLSKLKRRLGDGAFQVVDHWEGDVCAIGIAHPEEPRLLVYISTYRLPHGTYDISLESPPGPGSAFLYEQGEEHEGLDFKALVEVVAGHLGIPASP